MGKNKKSKKNHGIFRRKKRNKFRIRRTEDGRIVIDREYGLVMTDMIDIYEPDGEDWMGFKLAKNNSYTFHHINERRNNGPKEVDNGAILTVNAHTFLNYLDVHCHSAYEDYQNIFRKINLSHQKPDDDLREDIYGMMLDIFYYNTYNIDNKVLDRYEEYTYCK